MADANSRRFPLAIALILLLLAGAGFVLWWVQRAEENGAGVQDLTPEEAQRLVALKNEGVAALENGEFETANTVFEELAARLPEDPLGPRNRLISALFALDEEDAPQPIRDPAVRRDLAGQAGPFLQQLQDREGETALGHFLSGKLAEAAGDERRAAREYATAARMDADQPAYWYALYAVVNAAVTKSRDESITEDEALQRQARDAVKKAYELRPRNLHLLLELLGSQVKAKDPAIRETLEQAGETLRPIADAVQRRTRLDLFQLIEESLAALEDVFLLRLLRIGLWEYQLIEVSLVALEDGEWERIRRNTGPLRNVTLPEVAQHLDRRRVARHPLEYMLYDFTPEFYARVELPSPESESVPVTLSPAGAERQLPEMPNVLSAHLCDFDQDGRLDVVVGRDEAVEVYGRRADGESWQRICELALSFTPAGILAADFDRDVSETPGRDQAGGIGVPAPCEDADVDLAVYGAGGIVILRNRLDKETGRRTLGIVAQDAEFQELKNVGKLAVADLDHDGDLDLVVSSDSGISLWSNRDNFTFEEISSRSTLPAEDFRATDIVAADWDRSVDLDVLLAGGDSGPAGYLENLLHGRFRRQEFEGGFEAARNAVTLKLIDADGNASWDLLSAGENGISLTLTQTIPSGTLRARKTEYIDEFPAAGLATWDFDNDGFVDIAAWNENSLRIYRGLPGGRFEEATGILQQPPEQVTTCEIGDLENDGDLDLLIVENGKVQWYVNEGGNANNWLAVSIRGDPAKTPQMVSYRVNMHGIGSLLELKVGTGYQAQVVDGQTLHFGLGKQPQADVVRVLWTNGVPQNIIRPRNNEAVCAQQDLKGSCPYLYTWTGDRFEFFTDCLWAAPLGLQFAEGILAPTREWEYLKIPGDRLKAHNGEYRLQITEELWEAGYFDAVELIAVDHPAEVEIFSNEKVGPAEIARFKIHTVREPRAPDAARDQMGRDVLPELHARDNVYLKEFDSRIKQGFTPEHYIELDLGELDDPRQVTLFLTGWIFPTDASINISLSQHPQLDPPTPPSLWVPDEEGRWRQVMPYMGFPGGKTKTIAVDLSEAFLTDDYRVRIVSTMEIYWDHVFFTVDEPAAETKLHRMRPFSADLHYRGFSRRIEYPGHGPESYDYQAVDRSPRWPPMRGKFTRYGDVTELLNAADDRLVVLGAGDEMTLRFRVPEDGPPPGWKRDFLLYNVGWDKDADLSTVLGQTVEPLPFRAMQSYPFGPSDSPPEDPQYRAYLRKHQTRSQNRADFWQQIRRFRPSGNDRGATAD